MQELKGKESELNSMRIELEESHVKFMETDSYLDKCRNDMRQLEEDRERLNAKVR